MRKPNGIFLNDLVAADPGQSVFKQTHKPLALTTAEAERWKEFNSYEPRNHNQKVKEKLREQLNNASHELAVRREAEIFARRQNYGFAHTQKHYSWKVPEIE